MLIINRVLIHDCGNSDSRLRERTSKRLGVSRQRTLLSMRSCRSQAVRGALCKRKMGRSYSIFAPWKAAMKFDGVRGSGSIIATAVKAFILPTFLSVVISCTIVHKPISAQQASYDGNYRTSGVLEASADGVLVTHGWLDRYDDLLARYGKTLNPPRSGGDRIGVKPEGPNYRVTYEVSNRFADLNYQRRNSGP